MNIVQERLESSLFRSPKAYMINHFKLTFTFYRVMTLVVRVEYAGTFPPKRCNFHKIESEKSCKAVFQTLKRPDLKVGKEKLLPMHYIWQFF